MSWNNNHLIKKAPVKIRCAIIAFGRCPIALQCFVQISYKSASAILQWSSTILTVTHIIKFTLLDEEKTHLVTCKLPPAKDWACSSASAYQLLNVVLWPHLATNADKLRPIIMCQLTIWGCNWVLRGYKNS